MAKNIDMVRVLLEHGARPTNTDGMGVTAMHYAIINDDESTLALLLQKGAPVAIIDAVSSSPYQETQPLY